MKKLSLGTRQQRAQRADQNELFKRALNHFSDAVLLLDRRNKIILTNSKAPALLGLPRQAILGKPFDRIIRLEDPSTQRQVINLRAAEGPNLFFGSIGDNLFDVVALDIHRTPGFNKLKSKALLALIIRPSDINIASAPNLQLNILGQLTIRILHDLNNKLTSILGNTELIQEALATINATENNDPETSAGIAFQIISEVIAAIYEIAAVIRKFQDYAQQQPTSRHAIDLNAAISDYLPLSRGVAGSRLTIDFQPSTNLPTINANQKILNNLLFAVLNNCKERAGGARATVAISTTRVTLDEHFASTHPGARAGDHIKLVIVDHGQPLPPDSVPKPTHLFTSTNGDKGLLFDTIYPTVKQLNGYIDVESDDMEGTRFQIYFPLTERKHAPAAPAPKRHRPGSRQRRATRRADNVPLLILIAEDLPDIQHMMMRYLSKAGYHVEVSSTGPEALARFESLNSSGHQPALVIADLGLPDMDGRTLCSKIQTLNSNMPVLLTSGHAIPLDSTHTRTTDGLPFIAKPFKPAALLSRIDSLLNGAD